MTRRPARRPRNRVLSPTGSGRDGPNRPAVATIQSTPGPSDQTHPGARNAKGSATSVPAATTIARFVHQGARKRMRTHPTVRISPETWWSCGLFDVDDITEG